MANISFSVTVQADDGSAADTYSFTVREPTVAQVLASGDTSGVAMLYLLRECLVEVIGPLGVSAVLDKLPVSLGLQAGEELFAAIAARSKRS